MFIIYKSNKLNIILSKIHQIIQKKPLSNIFEKEIFIHDNKILFQYLNIFIANKIGISANFKLFSSDDFIWLLFNNFLSEKIKKNTFTQSIITWKIMKILDKKNEYINNTHDKTKKFKFAYLMASIFKKYLIYRPNWINSWERGGNASIMNNCEKWQIKLWKEIIDDTKKNNQSIYHFSNLFYDFQSLINEKKIKKNSFPSRLFIISSFSLNSSYIEIFKKISMYIKVYFLYITPFQSNIFNSDIIPNKTIILNKNKEHSNNSLISLWGQYEKFYMSCIFNDKKIKIMNCFKKNQNSTLLNSIKNDFFEYNLLNIKKNNKKRFLNLQDNSISINICFNKKNEIDVLHQKLLFFLNKNPSIQPSDIVVTSFSIEDYVPFINAVFNSENKKENIPFCIDEKYSKKNKILLSTFKKILELSNNRFKNEEILELLDIPEIANRFNISKEEIKILYNWIEEANIRWAIDGKHKKNLLLPMHNQNTWLYGIEKLLLSYAINNTEKTWNDILSCSLINGSRAELIGKLTIFINILEKWQKKLSRLQYLKYWRSLFHNLIHDFFNQNTVVNTFFQTIEKKWINMIDDGIFSNYTNKISINILKKKFNFKNIFKNKKFSPGAVNFCHPYSVYYIPFKIICIIGTDHKNILENNSDQFNLLNKYPLISDINMSQKYFYLFIQSISCTQKYFYISYIGYDIHNEKKIYSSIVIDQLLDYIVLNFCFVGDENLTIENNRKKIIKYLCKKHHKKNMYKIKIIHNSESKNFLNTFQNIKKNNQDLSQKNKFNSINLTQLKNFWKNPIRYFLNNYLQIKFNHTKEITNTTEPFLVNKIDSFEIKKRLLNRIVKCQDINQLFQYYMLSGKLPYSGFGKIFWNKQVQEIKSISELVSKYRVSTQEKKINLTIKKIKIKGVLSEIQEAGLLRWKPNTINYGDRISLWIEHLIYSIVVGLGESKIIGYKNQIWSFSPLKYDIALNYLCQYIQGYLKGLEYPILLTKSGSSWLYAIYDIKNKLIKNDDKTTKQADRKLLETWFGNDYVEGEKENLYIKQIITELNEVNIKLMCQTAKKWLVPLLENKK